MKINQDVLPFDPTYKDDKVIRPRYEFWKEPSEKRQKLESPLKRWWYEQQALKENV